MPEKIFFRGVLTFRVKDAKRHFLLLPIFVTFRPFCVFSIECPGMGIFWILRTTLSIVHTGGDQAPVQSIIGAFPNCPNYLALSPFLVFQDQWHRLLLLCCFRFGPQNHRLFFTESVHETDKVPKSGRCILFDSKQQQNSVCFVL